MENWRPKSKKEWNIARYQVWNIIGTCLYPVQPYRKNKRKKYPVKPNEGTMWGRDDNNLISFHYLFTQQGDSASLILEPNVPKAM